MMKAKERAKGRKTGQVKRIAKRRYNFVSNNKSLNKNKYAITNYRKEKKTYHLP